MVWLYVILMIWSILGVIFWYISMPPIPGSGFGFRSYFWITSLGMLILGPIMWIFCIVTHISFWCRKYLQKRR